MAEYLISKGANPSGDPLVCAMEYGGDKMVRLLIDHGADVNTKGVDCVHSEPGITDSQKWGSTPLCVAADKGKCQIIEMLLHKGADPHIRSRYGTPLEIARSRGYQGIVHMLEASLGK